MRNIILTISILFSLGAFAQRESKVSDSTRFTKGVRFDSTLVFKRLKAAAAKDTVLVIMDANGTVSKINKSNLLSGISGGGTQTLSISGDTLSISDGNSVVLPVYVQADSSTISSYDVLNSQNAPPGSPAIGDTYLVGNSPSGAWVGHAKDIAEWNGSAWVFTDGVQGDFLYNATTALTYIFRSGNWVQTTGIPALHNGNNISTGLTLGTRNNKDFNFISNNIIRGVFLSNGSFRVANQGLSGNVLLGANNLGIQKKIYLGGGLSLSNDTLVSSGGAFIPLSGTVEGSPVTGDIEVGGGSKFIYAGNVSTDFTGILINDADYITSIASRVGSDAADFAVDQVNATFSSLNASSRGIIGSQDFTPNITDLDYTQKIYVDTHIAFTTVPSSSTDTGVIGQMAVDAHYLYVCVATDTWTRIALSW